MGNPAARERRARPASGGAPEAPAHSGSAVPKVLPRSPSPAADRSASPAPGAAPAAPAGASRTRRPPGGTARRARAGRVHVRVGVSLQPAGLVGPGQAREVQGDALDEAVDV